MRINSNIAALNTANVLSTQNEASKRILGRLSSGLRVTGAADDAAGLAISEKMRSQVRGLNQAVRNARDGISLLRTAEGALQEMHSLLSRIRDLAVQSANDTNTAFDRGEIQKEVDQLKTELDRISRDTEFNTRKLFSGGDDYASFAEQVADILPEAIHHLMEAFSAFSPLKDAAYGMGVEFYDDPGALGGFEGATMTYLLEPGAISLKLGINLGAYEAAKEAPLSGNDLNRFKNNMLHEMVHAFMEILAPQQMRDATSPAPPGAEIYPKWFVEGTAQSAAGASGFISPTVNVTDLLNNLPNNISGNLDNTPAALQGRYGGGYLATMYLAWLETDKGAVTSENLRNGMNKLMTEVFSSSLDDTIQRLTAGAYSNADVFADGLKDDSVAIAFMNGLKSLIGNGEGSVVMANLWDSGMPPTDDITRNPLYVNPSSVWIKNNTRVNYGPIPWLGKPLAGGGPVYEKNALTLHIGANAGQNMKLSFINISTRTLKINTLRVTTQDDSEKAITRADAAINVVSSERAKLGALQNRLEHTVRNLTNTSENLQSAESRIRDQDMAFGVMELTKTRIMTQAATAMLAQATQMPRSVLRLLH